MEIKQLDRAVALADARRRAADGSARARREAARLSLRDVAAAVGVGAATVARWETGERRPHGEAALRWAALLDALDRGKSPGDV